MYSITSAEGLVLPEILNGYLGLESLTSAEGLKLPKILNGDLWLDRLTSAEGLVLPETLNGCLDLGGLTSIYDLKLPTGVKRLLLDNNANIDVFIGLGAKINICTNCIEIELNDEIIEKLNVINNTKIRNVVTNTKLLLSNAFNKVYSLCRKSVDHIGSIISNTNKHK